MQRLLRKHAKAVNLTQNFTIIDQDDQQLDLIKNICKSLIILISKKISPNFVLAFSIRHKWKNSGWYPKDVKMYLRLTDFRENICSERIYNVYQKKLTGFECL